ncbi:MAG: hypothetical protein H5T62_18280 [Anaerolineae bacterium]|nr:hypothetical protein [Anaerolineae bacterium]
MNGYETEPELAVFQALVGLMFALAFGPWLTLSGLRVILKPSRVEERSFINWVIRRASTHSTLATGNIRFWAWMIFLSGVGGDLIGIFALAIIVGILFFR